MSEIDFAEIEKAMAELVNKAQGKERQQGLGQAAKVRSQIAKEIETAHEQGNIATKRIIVASNAIRTNPHLRARPSAPIMPASPGRVMDFVSPSPIVTTTSPTHPPIKPGAEEGSQSQEVEDPNLTKTVGELSNEYLLDEVSNPEPEEVELAPSIEELPKTPASEQIENSDTKLEDLTGPAPNAWPTTQATIPNNFAEQDLDTENKETQNQLPEADNLAEEIGKVHKMYGQKLPKEYLKKQRSLNSPISNKVGKSKTTKKRGFGFYFTILMVLVAVGMWGLAAYLFLI